MSASLALRSLRTRVPAAAFQARATYATAGTHGKNPKNTPQSHQPLGEKGHDQWMPSLASASEEAVKADREDFAGNDELQEYSKKVTEEFKHTEKKPKDGLWRKVSGDNSKN
ncbi:unnamed protein product [Parascedosporium putredinis]|uniref:Uncharacterized protein n=1 Tax=Parascedosporium putredinis TaxID=1442378 RepID=A0A9P1HBU9_9PEZI|nr:unnamed protein product [Parascedosporium putredinis]CAI8004125.1 unnamed protein product [Parascedosporium putredinis]